MISDKHEKIIKNIEKGKGWHDGVLDLLERYYSIPGNECGGSLHILLDDWNIEDRFVQWCDGYACGKGDKLGSDIANIFLFMTEDQRERILDVFWNIH